MDRKLRIDTGGKSYAPYSPGISVRDHIWLSGQIDITCLLYTSDAADE